jgi:NAD(P)-dependent dehydrogenase (short-subunit alcohol dehydrogenase family)
VHASGCRKGPQARESIIFDHDGAPCTDSRYHRHSHGARRLGDPQVLAAAIVFLASPAAGYITGTTLVVDGGLMAF